MLTFLIIERPETANLRPCRWAIWMACCTRWMCEAKQATMTRPSASAKIWWNAWPTTASDGVEPLWTALVESPSSASTPCSPRRAKVLTSVMRPSMGVWSNL